MLVEQDFLNMGYQKFDNGSSIKMYPNILYQKMIEDERGIKYFLDIFKSLETDNYEVEAQFSLKTGEKTFTINVLIFNFFDNINDEHNYYPSDFELIENIAEDMFKNMNFEYYELKG